MSEEFGIDIGPEIKLVLIVLIVVLAAIVALGW